MLKQLFFLVVTFILTVSWALAFDSQQTHKQLTELAIAKTTNIENVLKRQLGINDSLIRKFSNGQNNYTPIKWFREGSYEEDDPSCRASSHFHNPLLPWEEAELTDSLWLIDKWCSASSPYRIKYSNLVWGTGYISKGLAMVSPPNNELDEINDKNGRNWNVARNLYYNALTSQTSINRESNLAETFRTLGYVMHLLQDMAVPAHTRNDFSQGHTRIVGCPEEGKCFPIAWIGNPFEGYVRDNFEETIKPLIAENISTPFIGEKVLTNFWDTDTVLISENDTPQTGFDIGLAEYTNANFVSNATIFKDQSDTEHYFPYPNRDSIADQEYPDQIDERLHDILARDGKLDKGVYIAKNNHGEVIDKFLKPRYILYGADWDTVERYDLKFTLDNQCYLEYAKKLIPRAVGYSAALIDYFFRGTLEISYPDQFVYSVIDGSNPHQFSSIKAKILNTSHLTDDNGTDIPEEADTGELFAVAKYRVIPNYLEDLSNYPQDRDELKILMGNVEFSYSVSQPITIDPSTNPIETTTANEFNFDFTGDEIPVGITDLSLQVIFKGTLGNEVDAGIAVGMKDLNEPAHIVFANSTDEIIMNGALTTADVIKNDPLLSQQVDWDSDGIFNEVVIDGNGINIGEPFIDPYDVSLQIGFSFTDPQIDPNAVLSYPINIDHLPAGRYASIILLTDTDPGNQFWWENLETRHYGADMENITFLNSFGGIYMHEGTPDWQYTPLTPTPVDYIHRGEYQHHLVGEYYCVGTPCPYLGNERSNYVDINPFPWPPLP